MKKERGDSMKFAVEELEDVSPKHPYCHGFNQYIT